MKRNKTRKPGSPQRSARGASSPVTGAATHRLVDLSVKAEAPAAWPSISVCMIVKNEGVNLRPCLESLDDLASEVIVVDTGSTDDTVEVAKGLGARVFHFPWIDDFAAARNESLAHASKEWVFWLDADDRLDSKAVAQIKAAAASGRADAYMAMVSSLKASGSQDVVEHVRLFRNGLGIRFSGAIHEGVYPDIVRLGLTLARTDISLRHTGYDSVEATRAKTARNLAIIERELAANPDSIELIFYRGQARRGVGDLGGAEADLRAYLARTKPGVMFDWTRFWAYSALAFTLQDLDRLPEAEALLRKALVEFPKHPRFLHHLGQIHLELGNHDVAVREMEDAYAALRGTVRGLKPSEALVEMGLAEAYSRTGRREKAAQWADRARSHAPTSYEAAELAARFHVEAGHIAEAEAVLSQMLAAVDLPDPWLLLGELRQKQGQWDEAAGAIEAARQRGLPAQEAADVLAGMKAARLLAETRTVKTASPEQSHAQIRGLAFLAQGEHLRAAECFADAVQSAPSNPDNYRYLAVALQALGQEGQAMEAWRLASQCQTQ